MLRVRAVAACVCRQKEEVETAMKRWIDVDKLAEGIYNLIIYLDLESREASIRRIKDCIKCHG
jgi:hypothetical protein